MLPALWPGQEAEEPSEPWSLRGAAWGCLPARATWISTASAWGRGPEDPRRPLYCEKLPAFHLGTSSWAPWERAVPSGAVLPPPGTWLRLLRPAALGTKLRKEQAWLPCQRTAPSPKSPRPACAVPAALISRRTSHREGCAAPWALPRSCGSAPPLARPRRPLVCPLLCRGSPSPCGLYPRSPDHCSYGILQ